MLHAFGVSGLIELKVIKGFGLRVSEAIRLRK